VTRNQKFRINRQRSCSDVQAHLCRPIGLCLLRPHRVRGLCKKTTEPIEMPFGVESAVSCGPKESFIRWGQVRTRRLYDKTARRSFVKILWPRVDVLILVTHWRTWGGGRWRKPCPSTCQNLPLSSTLLTCKCYRCIIIPISDYTCIGVFSPFLSTVRTRQFCLLINSLIFDLKFLPIFGLSRRDSIQPIFVFSAKAKQ